jgi:hypothetical protein
MTTPLTPDAVIAQVAAALPQDCRSNVIIIGSLAAGYHFFSGDAKRSIRTKDVDCMFSPHAKAVAAALEVTTRLLEADWTPRKEGDWSEPGNEHTPDDKLPIIRLKPPATEGGTDWFLELLGAPDEKSGQTKTFYRVPTRMGHFAICSYNYLALTEWNPVETKYGVRVARPEMMALSNMLHHPKIGPELIKGTTTKRSNKDLGRVLALAWLTAQQDRRSGTEEFDSWAARMADALRTRFPDHASQLAQSAGDGLRELMGSKADRDEALSICNRGLLASMEVSREAFEAIGLRYLQQVVEPLSDATFG